MLIAVSDQPAPPEIVALAEERSRARAARDWQTADELRAHIAAAGWRIEDHDLDFELSPLRAPDIVEAGRTLYGSPDAVPSRAEEPGAPETTVVLVAMAADTQVAAQLAALHEHALVDTRVLVIAARDVDPAELALASEIVWMAAPWAAGAALRAALRRVAGRTVVIVGQGTVPAGDIVTPLVVTLADDTVAIAGSAGLLSADLWGYEPGPPGDVTVVTAACYAFRRQDALERGGVDGRLLSSGGVAAWLSLELRDAGAAVPPRRAVAIELPLQPLPPTPGGEQAHLERRDRYRVAERFKGRIELAHPGPVHKAAPSREGEVAF